MQAGGDSSQEDNGLMAAINITPLTDVLLVLLIIFMITASMLQKEAISIPVTHTREQALDTDLVISVRKNGGVFVGAALVPLSDLKPYLEQMVKSLPLDAAGTPIRKVILKAEAQLPYGVVGQVMDAANSAGLHEVSLATNPLENRDTSHK